jgi:hypothetical protein
VGRFGWGSRDREEVLARSVGQAAEFWEFWFGLILGLDFFWGVGEGWNTGIQ